MKVGKEACQHEKNKKNENSGLVQARAPELEPWVPKSMPKWIQNEIRIGPRGRRMDLGAPKIDS